MMTFDESNETTWSVWDYRRALAKSYPWLLTCKRLELLKNGERYLRIMEENLPVAILSYLDELCLEFYGKSFADELQLYNGMYVVPDPKTHKMMWLTGLRPIDPLLDNLLEENYEYIRMLRDRGISLDYELPSVIFPMERLFRQLDDFRGRIEQTVYDPEIKIRDDRVPTMEDETNPEIFEVRRYALTLNNLWDSIKGREIPTAGVPNDISRVINVKNDLRRANIRYYTYLKSMCHKEYARFQRHLNRRKRKMLPEIMESRRRLREEGDSDEEVSAQKPKLNG